MPKDRHPPLSLARPDLRHIVVLAESAEVLVELLHLLLVRFDTLALHLFLQPLSPVLFVPLLGLGLLPAPTFFDSLFGSFWRQRATGRLYIFRFRRALLEIRRGRLAGVGGFGALLLFLLVDSGALQL